MPGFESLSIGVLLWVVAVMALAGFVQGALGLGFPIVATPLIIYYLGLGITPAALVQALNICFFVGKTTQFATLASVGGVSLTQWLVTLPLALVATIHRALRRAHPQPHRRRDLSAVAQARAVRDGGDPARPICPREVVRVAQTQKRAGTGPARWDETA